MRTFSAIKSRTNSLKVYIEWLRESVLGSGWSEGRVDFALDIPGEH